MGFDKIAAICQKGIKISDPICGPDNLPTNLSSIIQNLDMSSFQIPTIMNLSGIKILDLSAIFNSIFTY